ncbi:MAG: CD225/dispanin family protein [Bacteroidaceae bacterium]|nr:CD225/dispanin family protein [Bacteroidaceae bacterium]
MSEQRNVCPDSNLVWAILCTVLCCLPLGIVAIVKASSVEKLWVQERYDEAQKASADAKKYSIWGAVIAGIGIALYIIVLVIAMIAGGM